MLMSEGINELAAALAKAQGRVRGATKDVTNTFFKSKYADLNSVVEAIRAPFADNGLSYVQTTCCRTSDRGTEVGVETVIMHASGQWLASGYLWMPVGKDDPQARMSALTYCRRGSLASTAGVAPEDDDGNGATSREGTGMSDVTRTMHLREIAEAQDVKALQKAYTTAVRAAQAVGDKIDVDVFVKAKDTRKAKLAQAAE